MRVLIAIALFAAIAPVAKAQCGPNGTLIRNTLNRPNTWDCTGKTGVAGYTTTFTGQTGLTVTATTHGQGLKPVGFCYDNSTPANLIAETAGFPTVAANGDIVFAWTGSKTGYCIVSALGTAVGPQGAQGIQGNPGPAPSGTGAVVVSSGSASTVTAGTAGNYLRDNGTNFVSAGLNASDASTGTLPAARLPATVVQTNQANTYTAGDKQSHSSSATTAMFNFGSLTSDPSSLSTSDFWYRSDTFLLSYIWSGTKGRIPYMLDAAMPTAGDCLKAGTALGSIVDAGAPCGSGGGGGGSPYTATVTAQTSTTVNASTHGMGVYALAACFDNATPANEVSCTYTRDSSGNIVFSWNPAFTGLIEIYTSGGGGGGGAVSSVFTRTGAVTAQSGDYTVSQVTGAAPTLNPTFTGTVTMPGPTFNNITGSTQCLQANSSGVVSGTGSTCGSGGGGANANGYYVVTQSTNAPVNAVNLGTLSSGLVKIAVASSIATPSTATPDTDYGAAANACPASISTGTLTLGSGANCTTYNVTVNAAITGCSGPTGLVGKSYTFHFVQDSTGHAVNLSGCTTLKNPPIIAQNASSYTDWTADFDGTNLNSQAGTTSGTPLNAESAAPSTPPASECTQWFDSTDHDGELMCNNSANVFAAFLKGGDANPITGVVSKINGTAFSGTNGHLVSFGASNVPADSGIVATAVTQTIASGTATLGTSSINANTCASAVTVSASGVATTDAITYTPNADISGVTGYGVASTDGLIIYPYPTANNVSFRVCNSTGASITPGSVTLNWRVTR